MRRFLYLLTAALFASACGQSTPEAEPPKPDPSPKTPYGTVAEVEAYITEIQPFVQKVTELQVHFEGALASATADADDRRGTGRNLASKAEEIRPQLLDLIDRFEGVEPPPLLAPFHRDVKKLMALRLDAYRQTIAGWEAEEAGGAYKGIYDQAERTLDEANQLIVTLNAQMNDIGTAVAAVTEKRSP